MTRVAKGYMRSPKSMVKKRVKMTEAEITEAKPWSINKKTRESRSFIYYE